MKTNFNGFNEMVLTFENDGTVKKGDWVKLSQNGTVGLADENSELVGIVVNERNGFCGVKVNGTVTANKSGNVSLGYQKLVYTANGIAVNDNGRKHLVVSVDDETITFIL